MRGSVRKKRGGFQAFRASFLGLNAPALLGQHPPIDTPISISLEEHLTPDEREQIQQTIGMFETIAQANPDDAQSLEILKEAYWKIGRQADSVATARLLADAYMRTGQYSSALMEYEGILQQELPAGEAEIIRGLLVDLESRIHPSKSTAKNTQIALDYGMDESVIGFDDAPEGVVPAGGSGVPELRLVTGGSSSAQSGMVGPDGTLIATGQTRRAGATGFRQVSFSLDSDGAEPLAKFLLQHRLVSHEIAATARERMREINASPEVQQHQAVAASLLNEVANAGVEIEPLLIGLIDRTKIAYIPLEHYDIDRQIVKMLPENLTLGRVMVPFDIVSRTMMIALDNPFDSAAKSAIQQSVDYHIQWHIARPSALQKALRDAYRIR